MLEFDPAVDMPRCPLWHTVVACQHTMQARRTVMQCKRVIFSGNADGDGDCTEASDAEP